MAISASKSPVLHQLDPLIKELYGEEGGVALRPWGYSKGATPMGQ